MMKNYFLELLEKYVSENCPDLSARARKQLICNPYLPVPPEVIHDYFPQYARFRNDDGSVDLGHILIEETFGQSWTQQWEVLQHVAEEFIDQLDALKVR